MPVVIAVNKVDRLRPARRSPPSLQAAAELGVGDEIFPISARTGRGRRARSSTHLGELLPEGPFYFPAEERSDQPEQVMLAELVREQVLRRTFQEVPHAVEVEIEEIDERARRPDRRARR